MKLNEYKISDFPNFDLYSNSNNIKLDFPSLISDYIYDLEDGLNIKLHAEKEDEEGYLYDEFNLNDLQYYCDIKNLDYKFPDWIESLSIKVYHNDSELEENSEVNGFVNIPLDDKSDITYNPDTKKLKISNFTIYSWKNKDYTKSVISHELTHCYDFYKKFLTGNPVSELEDNEGEWKSVYDLDHEDNLFLYGVKADEFKENIKKLDPDNYNLYRNTSLKILDKSSLWRINDNPFVFCLVVCELFYYLDISEMKAFYVSGKNVKNIYKNIYNICSNFPDISDKLLKKLSNNSELSDMFKKFIFNVLGIKLKNNFSEFLKEIQFELVDDAHDAAELFKQNLINESVLHSLILDWNNSDLDDSGIISQRDIKNRLWEKPLLSVETNKKYTKEIVRIVQYIINLLFETGIVELNPCYDYSEKLKHNAFYNPASMLRDTINIFKDTLKENPGFLSEESIQKYYKLWENDPRTFFNKGIQEENIYLTKGPLKNSSLFYNIGNPTSPEYYKIFMKLVNKLTENSNIIALSSKKYDEYASSWQMYLFMWKKPINNEYLYFYLVRPTDYEETCPPELTFIISTKHLDEL